MDFSGHNLITINPLFENIRNNFTYEFWVKPRAPHRLTVEANKGARGLSGQRYVIGPGHSGNIHSAGMGISVGTNGVSVFEHSHNYLPALLVYETTITTWTHIAVVYINRTPYLYINGEFIKKGLKSPKSDVYASGVIGGHNYGFFVGEVREVRLWDYARTEKQINMNLTSNFTGKEAGLFGFWKLDQEINLIQNNEKSIENKMDILKVSCILTSYNRPNKVQEAIASVQAQTYPHWELIIVDDNSNEYTQNILKDIVQKDNRIKLIQSRVQENDRAKTTRYATCINLALPFVKGDLVTYLTDDDIFYPIRFEKMVEAFQQNPKINVVYGKQKVVMISNNRTMRSSIRPLVGVTRSPMNRVDHNSFMHRKSCLDIVRNWDDHPSLWMAADAAFFKKLAAHWDFYPINVLTDEHRIHDKGVQKKLSRGLKPWIGSDAE